MNESKPSYPYMDLTGRYVDPTSKYYIDRMWEEYHKIKEELAQTKCKLGQSEDIIDALKTLVKQLHKDEDKLIQTIETLREPSDEIIKLRQQTSVLRELLIELTDVDDCQYDHHGYCQAHSLHTAPCPHSRSKTFIKEMHL